MALADTKLTIDDVDKPEVQKEDFDYAHRAQWLRAAVLGANDGLVSTASMMIGVSAVKTDVKSMVLTGFAGLVAGACSMAIGEFVSVYSQVDVEVAQMKRAKSKRAGSGIEGDNDGSGSDAAERRPDQLPSPVQAAVASALAFSVGALVPLLAAGFIKRYRVRVGVVPAAVTLALLGFGVTGAKLGGVPVGRSTARVLVGGWMAMAVTYGLMKVVGSTGGL